MRLDKFRALHVRVRRTQPLIFSLIYQRLNRTEISLSLLSSLSLRRRTFPIFLFASFMDEHDGAKDVRTVETRKENGGSERGNCYANYEYDWCVMQT